MTVMWLHMRSRKETFCSSSPRSERSDVRGLPGGPGRPVLSPRDGPALFCTISDQSPSPIARIACFREDLKPPLRVIVELGGQHPVQEQGALLGRVVAIHLHESLPPARYPHDLPQCADDAGPVQIV